MKLLFTPVGILAGLGAGFAAKKLFDAVWGLIDDEEPPEPEHRDVDLRKLATALALQGALFRLVRGLTEHQARRGFASLVGSWPGEEEPEPK